MSSEKENKTSEQENEQTGKLAGTGAGVLTGAAIGSAFMPVVGTFAGALVGGVVGSEVGKKVGGKILDRMNGKKEEAAHSGAKPDVTAELERLAKLHKQGVLDDDEFKAAKARLLNL